MKQTPSHDVPNPALLRLMVEGNFARVVEVGCSRGALARAYRERYPATHYIGIDMAPEYTKVAASFCDRVLCGDIEQLGSNDWESLFPSDCWVFGDSLEHLRDPLALLCRLRSSLPATAQVLSCIPNAQHWTVQARLAAGLFRYEAHGLMDRTHLRWFTRITILEMFDAAGFRISQMFPRTFPEPAKDHFLAAIRSLAEAGRVDADQAVRDALPFQYVVVATPK